MRILLSTVRSVLILGVAILAIVACGKGSDAGDVERTPDMGQMESSGATAERATAEPQQVQASPPPTATPVGLTVFATTTEAIYITADNLASAPTGSSDARGKIVAHSHADSYRDCPGC